MRTEQPYRSTRLQRRMSIGLAINGGKHGQPDAGIDKIGDRLAEDGTIGQVAEEIVATRTNFISRY